MGSCARPSISAGLWFSLVPAVFAGCRQSLLTDGPSRYYPCTPCVGAWTHTPPSPVGALALFFPTDIGLASQETRSANRKYPCSATSSGSVFSRLQSFATFRLLRSLGPRIAPTAPPRGSGQLGRLHHALPGQLPVSSCGIATCLIRAIDMTGLSPVGLQSYRLLLPALRSSEVDLQHSDSLQLPVREIQLWSQ
jgi:hypothetical protein